MEILEEYREAGKRDQDLSIAYEVHNLRAREAALIEALEKYQKEFSSGSVFNAEIEAILERGLE